VPVLRVLFGVLRTTDADLQFVTLSTEPRTLTCVSYPCPKSVIIYLWLSPRGQGQFSIITECPEPQRCACVAWPRLHSHSCLYIFRDSSEPLALGAITESQQPLTRACVSLHGPNSHWYLLLLDTQSTGPLALVIHDPFRRTGDPYLLFTTW